MYHIRPGFLLYCFRTWGLCLGVDSLWTFLRCEKLVHPFESSVAHLFQIFAFTADNILRIRLGEVAVAEIGSVVLTLELVVSYDNI